jgi:hypothetical protein
MSGDLQMTSVKLLALGKSVTELSVADVSKKQNEPRRVYRRLFGLSYAAMRVSSSMA